MEENDDHDCGLTGRSQGMLDIAHIEGVILDGHVERGRYEQIQPVLGKDPNHLHLH